MNLLGPIEAAATAGTPWGWLRLALRLLPWAIIVALVLALVVTRATLRDARTSAQLAAAHAQADAAADKARWAATQATQAQAYADTIAKQQPVIVRATDTVRTSYATTPAGRAVCAGPDLVRGTDALDAQLFPTSPAAGGR